MAQTPRPADAGISIGQVFLGKYRVDSILGQGGMGIVAKCTHLGLNDPVAIKMLRQDVLLDRDATERFMREAQAAFKLRSEHVARVVDVGTDTETGVPYMVMEFLDGHDLGQLLEQQGPIAHGWASMLMLQAAEALAEAHSIGIVHRDVKPTNLFVTWRPDGSSIVKVLDFGISKAPAGSDMQLTQTQSLLGTPAYMSPEQMRSARLVDLRTDIWSLGVVFYELLEGHRPFEAESFSEMCVKVAVDPPAPMVQTPPPLQQVVLRCLAKSPEQRYANMAELGRDLLPYVQDVHEASLLVERMQRMVGRRAAVDWDRAPGTNGGRIATPLPMRDASGGVVAASGAIPTPAPRSAPVAVVTPLRTATPAAGMAVPVLDDPLGHTATEIDAPALVPRRRKLPLVLAALALVAGAAALVFVLSNGGPADHPEAASEDHGGPAGTGPATPAAAVDAGKPDDDPTATAGKPATATDDKPATAADDKPTTATADKPTTATADKPAPTADKPAPSKHSGRGRPHVRRPPRGNGRQSPKPDKHDDKPKPPDCPVARRIPGGGCAPQ